jgi:hypothetical protein
LPHAEVEKMTGSQLQQKGLAYRLPWCEQILRHVEIAAAASEVAELIGTQDICCVADKEVSPVTRSEQSVIAIRPDGPKPLFHSAALLVQHTAKQPAKMTSAGMSTDTYLLMRWCHRF